MIFDAHAHYDDEAFESDRDELLLRLNRENGVKMIINGGCDIESSRFSLELSKKYSFIKATVGIHPHEAESVRATDYLPQLKALLEDKNAVAIGEIGLDYHYDFSPRELQLKIFEEQLILAKELDKPVVVHDREAHLDTLTMLKKYQPKGLVHCFSGSVEMMREIIKLGMSISLGGAVTFKNAKTPLLVAKEVPLNRLLLETDAPYMTPVPFRGKRNDSSLISYTAEKIAEVRGITKGELLTIVNENACKLFNVKI